MTETATPTGIGPDDPTRYLSVRNPDSDESLPHYGAVGDNYTILLTGADTDGRYGLIDMFVPPGGGPPPHRHDFEEMFHVLEGEIEFMFRGEHVTVSAGQTLNIPARAPHNFHNASSHNARMLCMVTPAGLERYFTEWGKPLPTRTAHPDMGEEEIAERMGRAFALGPEYALDNNPTM
ncbi:cupin domain-containing protein [Glycomyces tarimensis]